MYRPIPNLPRSASSGKQLQHGLLTVQTAMRTCRQRIWWTGRANRLGRSRRHPRRIRDQAVALTDILEILFESYRLSQNLLIGYHLHLNLPSYC